LKGWQGDGKTGAVKNWTVIDGALICLGAAQDAMAATWSAMGNIRISNLVGNGTPAASCTTKGRWNIG
jgi:hypothetical protein